MGINALQIVCEVVSAIENVLKYVVDMKWLALKVKISELRIEKTN
jgi:hypothetical protein